MKKSVLACFAHDQVIWRFRIMFCARQAWKDRTSSMKNIVDQINANFGTARNQTLKAVLLEWRSETQISLKQASVLDTILCRRSTQLLSNCFKALRESTQTTRDQRCKSDAFTFARTSRVMRQCFHVLWEEYTLRKQFPWLEKVILCGSAVQ